MIALRSKLRIYGSAVVLVLFAELCFAESTPEQKSLARSRGVQKSAAAADGHPGLQEAVSKVATDRIVGVMETRRPASSYTDA